MKPDQLIKRRGKLGLIKVNASYDEVKAWLNERLGTDIKVSSTSGKSHFRASRNQCRSFLGRAALASQAAYLSHVVFIVIAIVDTRLPPPHLNPAQKCHSHMTNRWSCGTNGTLLHWRDADADSTLLQRPCLTGLSPVYLSSQSRVILPSSKKIK